MLRALGRRRRAPPAPRGARPAPRPILEELEPRLLYAADHPLALLGVAAEPAQVQAWAPAADLGGAAADAIGDAGAAGLATSQPQRLEIVFIDGGLGGADALAASWAGDPPEGVQRRIVVLDPRADALRQIGAELAAAGAGTVDAVHLVSHGSPGQLQLGAQVLDQGALQARADEVRAWQAALGDDADLLIYGCDLAASADGRAFVALWAELTGTDVTASQDATGSAALGGNWELEYATGALEASAGPGTDAQEGFSGLLAISAGSSSTAGSGTGVKVSSLTWSHTVGSGNDRVLIVGVSMFDSGSNIVSSVTYGGQALTRIGQDSSSKTHAEMWMLTAPVEGTADIVVSLTKAVNVVAGATAYSGVDQSTPYSTVATGNGSSDPTFTVASAAGELVVDIVADRDVDSETVGAGQTAQWVLKNGTASSDAWGGSSSEQGAASVTMSWSTVGAGAGEWAAVAVSLRPSSNTAPVLDSSKTPVLDAVAEDAGAPVGAVGTLVSALVDLSGPAGGLDNVTDNDSGALSGIAVVGADASHGSWWFSVDDGANWAALGAPSDASARLLAADAVTRLYFEPDADWSGTLDPAIAFRAWDQTSGANGAQADATVNGGTTAFSVATDTAALSVAAVNDAPGMPGVALGSTSEDSSKTWQVADFASFSWDVDAGALKGLAIVGVDDSHGTWQYTLDGSNWLDIGAVAANNALLLAADATSAFRFVPDADWNGSTGMLQYKAWDQTSGTAGSYADASVSGGSTAFSGTSGSVLQVTAVNDAPTALAASVSLAAVPEDSAGPAGATVSALFAAAFSDARDEVTGGSSANAFAGIAIVGNAADAATEGTWQWHDGSGWADIGTSLNTASALTLSPATLVRFLPNADYNGSPGALTVRLVDDSGGAVTDGATVNVGAGGGSSRYSDAANAVVLGTSITAVNDAPLITSHGGGASAALGVQENTSAVGTVTSSDIDGGAATYSIVAGGDGAKFTIDAATGVLGFLAAPDFENPADIDGDNVYELTVQVGDGAGGSDTQAISVTVTDVADGIRVTPVSLAALGGETRVNTTTADTQAINPNVAQAIATDADGNFVVVWASNLQDGSAYGIYAQRHAADGSAQGSEFLVNTATADNQINPAVAMDAAGNFVVAWASNLQDGSGYGVYAQRFDAAGTAQGVEFLVNTTTAGGQSGPAIAVAPSGDFVITWTGSGQDPDASSGIYAQRYDASGVAQGGEFRVNSYTLGTQQLASAAMDAAGNFVVTWASLGQDGDNYGVYGQRFDATGAAQGAEFRVNTTTADSQLYHDVVMLPDGRFAVAFQSRNADGTFEVDLQRYAADGSAVGGEIRVNTSTVSAAQQPIPSLTADSSGNLTVVWNSAADGSGTAVVARRLDWSGTPLGAEFQVNTTTAGDQLYPEVVSQPGGGLLVAWGGNGDGDASGVFLQRYGLTTTEGGGVASFSVVLEAAPSADVEIPVSVADASEGTIAVGSLIFTTANWNIAQTVTVTGVQDYVNDGDQRYQIVVGPATSADPNFDGLDVADLVVTNLEIPNVAPINSVPGPQSLSEDTTLVFSSANGNAIAIADADAGGGLVEVVLTATQGSLTLGGTAGLSFITGDGSDDALLQFTGTVADINAALEGLSFAPTADYAGPASLQIVTGDMGNSGTGGASSDSDTVSITVDPVNDAPVITGSGGTLVYTENDAATAVDPGLTLSDVDSGNLSEAQVWIGSNYVDGQDVLGFSDQNGITGNWDAATGTLSLSGSATVAQYETALRSVTYVNTSDAPSTATRVVQFAVDDGAIVSNTASRDVGVVAVNDAPTTSPVVLAPIDEDSGPRVITQAELLANAGDVDGDALVATGLTISAGNGSLVDNGGGTWTYTPAADDDTSVSFGYTISDGTASVAGSVTLDITPVNDAPSTTPVVLAPIAEDSGARLITQAELLANAADVDGDALTATGLAIAAGNGSLTDNGDGTWTYTPAADDDSSVSFGYTISDGQGGTVAGTATLNITPVNDAPTASPVVLAPIAEDSGVRVITQAELLANAADVDGDALTASGLTIAAGNGSLVDNGDGTWTYTPAADDDTSVSFGYTISDGAASVAGAATLAITPVNDAPTTTPVVLAPIAEDSGPRLITQAELLANSADIDGDALTANGLTITAGNGNLVDNGDGTWTFTPAADDDTSVSFGYTISDGTGSVASAATLDITSVNDAPTTTPVVLAPVAEDSGARLIT
ncbi:MAG: cadherin-like domain-containing protein, partial [Burkholderiales bacterium]|nr:cadherin-like domain-containing protein [Burkholderiales bacterium]